MELQVGRKKARVIKDGNRVVKEFYVPCNHLNEEWLEIYDRYRMRYNNTVKVYEYSNDHIVMDYVEGELLNNDNFWNAKEYSHFLFVKFHYIQQQLADFRRTFYEFATMNTFAFYHVDAGHGNMLVTKDDKIMLIDPDSFMFDDFVDNDRLQQLSKIENKYFSEASAVANKHRQTLISKGVPWK